MSVLNRLRQKIVDRDYYLSSHADEEMWDDDLCRRDVENAILKGRIDMMKCDLCGEETQLRQVRKQHWFEGRLYVVENVAAEVCQECGQRYYHASVLDEIDALLSRNHEVKRSLQVEVVSL